MKILTKNHLENVFSIVLIALFLNTGFSKLVDLSSFRAEMYQSPIIPKAIIPALSIALPSFEIILSVLLFANKYKSIGYYLSFLTMLFFTFYLVVLVSFFNTNDIPCACGGVIGDISYGAHILLNIIFTVVSLIGLTIIANKREVLY